MLWAGVGSRVGSTAWRMHAFHPALLADAASHVRHDRDVAEALERRCSHPERGAAAELPRRTSNARACPRHQRPRHAGEHRYSCNRASWHCHWLQCRRSMMSRAPRHCQRQRQHCYIAQFARTAVLALLYRSMYRIKEPRQQPNEDSQRRPRRWPPTPRVSKIKLRRLHQRPEHRNDRD